MKKNLVNHYGGGCIASFGKKATKKATQTLAVMGAVCLTGLSMVGMRARPAELPYDVGSRIAMAAATVSTGTEVARYQDAGGNWHSFDTLSEAVSKAAAEKTPVQLLLVQCVDDRIPGHTINVLELSQTLVIPDGAQITLGSILCRINSYGDRTYESATQPTILRRSSITRLQGPMIKVENGGTLKLGLVTLDGGAVWAGGSPLISDDGQGGLATVQTNNTGLTAQNPIVVNRGALIIETGATLCNNENIAAPSGAGSGSQNYGGAIRNEGSASLVMTGGSIRDCYAREGGAILNLNKSGTEGYMPGARALVVISGGSFTGNVSQRAGAAIHTVYGGASTRVIGGVRFFGNTSLHCMGTLSLEEGGTLEISGGTIMAPEGDYAVYFANRYGEADKTYIEGINVGFLSLSGSPVLYSPLHLDAACTVTALGRPMLYAPSVDVAGYSGDPFILSIQNLPGDYNAKAMADTLSQLKSLKIHLENTAHPAYTYIQTTASGYVLYVGEATVQFTQTKPGVVTLTGHVDALALTGAEVLLGGKTFPVVVRDNQLTADIDVSDMTSTFLEGTLRLHHGNAQGDIPLSMSVVYLKDGIFTVPDGTLYTTMQGDTRPLMNGLLPNDILITPLGKTTLYVDGEERILTIGTRAMPATPPEVSLASSTANSLTLYVGNQASLEFTLIDKDGRMLSEANWVRPSNGTVAFYGLRSLSTYRVVVRCPAGGSDTLPGPYVICSETSFTTLSPTDAEAIEALKKAMEALEGRLGNPPTATKQEVLDALDKYNQLSDVAKQQPGMDQILDTLTQAYKALLVQEIQQTPADGMDAMAVTALKQTYIQNVEQSFTVSEADLMMERFRAAMELQALYDTFRAENSTLISTDLLVLSSARNQGLNDISHAPSPVKETLNAAKTTLMRVGARLVLTARYEEIVGGYAANGIVSDEAKHDVAEVYQQLLKFLEETKAVTALQGLMKEGLVQLDQAECQAILTDYVTSTDTPDTIAVVTAAKQAIAQIEDAAEMRRIVEKAKLDVERARAKAIIRAALTEYPSVAGPAKVAPYLAEGGIIDALQSPADMRLEAKRAQSILRIEYTRERLHAMVEGDDKAAEKRAAVDDVLDEALKKIATATTEEALEQLVNAAMQEALGVIQGYDMERFLSDYADILSKGPHNVTAGDLPRIQQALDDLRTNYSMSVQEELSAARDQLLEMKKAAMVDALQTQKSDTELSAVIDTYIQNILRVDISGGVLEDMYASSELDQLYGQAWLAIQWTQYKQEIIRSLEAGKQPGDSREVTLILEIAKQRVGELAFQPSKSLDEQKQIIDDIYYQALMESVLQRSRDQAIAQLTAYYQQMAAAFDKDGIRSEAARQSVADVLDALKQEVNMANSTADIAIILQEGTLRLDKARGKAMLRDYLTPADAEDIRALVESACTDIDLCTSSAGIDSIVSGTILRIEKQRAKDAVRQALTEYPSAAGEAKAQEYLRVGGILDAQTTVSAVWQEAHRICAILRVEYTRETLKDKVEGDPNGEEKKDAIDDILDKALEDIEKADPYDDDTDHKVNQAIEDAKKELSEHDEEDFRDKNRDILEKPLEDITKEDLPAIDKALEELDSYSKESQEAMDDLRNDLLTKKKKAIADALESYKDGSSVDQVVDTYIKAIMDVDISGDADADRKASETMDKLMEEALQAISFEKYKQDVVAQLEALRTANDSKEVRTLLNEAQRHVRETIYDPTLTQEAQRASLDEWVAQAVRQVEHQRQKDQAKASYLGALSEITGKTPDLQDAEIEAVLEAIQRADTTEEMNRVIQEAVKQALVDLLTDMDSDMTRAVVKGHVNAVDDAVATANAKGKVADLTAAVRGVARAVEAQRAKEKDAIKKALQDAVQNCLNTSPVPLTDQERQMVDELLRQALQEMDNATYPEYPLIQYKLKQQLVLLKAYMDMKAKAPQDNVTSLTPIADAMKQGWANIWAAENTDAVLACTDEGILSMQKAYAAGVAEGLLASGDSDYVKQLITGETGALVQIAQAKDQAALEAILAKVRVEIAGERFLDTCPILRLDTVNVSGEHDQSLRDALQAYATLPAAVQAYLDECVAGIEEQPKYPSFEAKLTDACMKAQFESMKQQILADLAQQLKTEQNQEMRAVIQAGYDRISALTYQPQKGSTIETIRTNGQMRMQALRRVEEETRCAILFVSHKLKVQAQAQDLLQERLATGRYSGAQRDQLLSIVQNFQEQISRIAIPTDETGLSEAERQLDALWESAKTQINAVPVSQLVVGDIDPNHPGNAQYPEHGHEGIWGMISNPSSLPADVVLMIEERDSPLKSNVQAAIKSKAYVPADQSLKRDELGALVDGKRVQTMYDVYLMQDNKRLASEQGTYTVRILLTEEMRALTGLQVVSLAADGRMLVYRTTVEDNYLVFTAPQLTEFFVLCDEVVNTWGMIATLSAVWAIELVALAATLYWRHSTTPGGKKKKQTGRVKTSCFALPVLYGLTRVTIPAAGDTVCAILGVCILVTGVAIVALWLSGRRRNAQMNELLLDEFDDISEPAPTPAPKPQPAPTPAPIVMEERKEITVEEAHDAITDEMAETLVVLEHVETEAVLPRPRDIVNIDTLSDHFNAGDVVTLEALKQKKLIDPKVNYVKVLARGTLNKPLTVKAPSFSPDAVKMISLMGGTAVRLQVKD